MASAEVGDHRTTTRSRWSREGVFTTTTHADGSLWDFAPVQDVARDNRWGRCYETWGEEPALTAAPVGSTRAPRR